MRWFHSGRRSMAVIAGNTSAGAASMMALAWPWKIGEEHALMVRRAHGRVMR